MSLAKLEIIVHAIAGTRPPQEQAAQPTAAAIPGATTRTVKSMRRRKPQAGRA